MTETPTLQELIAETVNAYCAQNGGGIPLGFLFAIQRIDSDGASNIHLGCMDGQSPLASAGLLAYLDQTVRIEIEDDLYGCECPDDEDDD